MRYLILFFLRGERPCPQNKYCPTTQSTSTVLRWVCSSFIYLRKNKLLESLSCLLGMIGIGACVSHVPLVTQLSEPTSLRDCWLASVVGEFLIYAHVGLLRANIGLGLLMASK